MDVIAASEGFEAEMRVMVVTRTRTGAEIAVMSPFTAHMDHSFRGSQTDY